MLVCAQAKAEMRMRCAISNQSYNEVKMNFLYVVKMSIGSIRNGMKKSTEKSTGGIV